MNLSQLEVLVAIVDAGNMTEAGRMIGLTQSAVSHSLARLEAELGVTLLERGNGQIKLTHIGEQVLLHALGITSHMEAIRQETARERGLSVGKIRIGYIPDMGNRLVMGIVRDFKHTFPEIEIRLYEGNIEEIENWLTKNVIDIGTTLYASDYPLSTPLAHDRVYVILNTHHSLSAKSVIHMHDIVGEHLIGSKATYAAIRQLPDFHDIALPRLQYEVSTPDTIFAMVRDGYGISLISERLREALPEGILARPLQPDTYVNIFLASHQRSPAIHTFMKSATVWSQLHQFLVIPHD